MVAVLVRLFGFEDVEVAEDISSETFLEAIEIWPYKGTPQNPAAWLYAVAKNKAKNHIKRKIILFVGYKRLLRVSALRHVYTSVTIELIFDAIAH